MISQARNLYISSFIILPMEKRAVITILFLVLMVSFVSGEVFFTQQPKESYNLGDQINVVLGSDGDPGWVNVNLVCGGLNGTSSGQLAFFYYMKKGETSVPVNVPLTQEFLRGSQGACRLSMVYNSVTKESLAFDISSNLDVDVTFNNNIFKPNETVYFTGTVYKQGGEEVNGFAEVTFSYNGLEMIVPVVDGEFDGNISLQGTIPSGSYNLDLFVYEKDESDAITNFFVANNMIEVAQDPRGLKIDVVKTINPDSDLDFVANLLDQTNTNVDGLPVAFTLVNPAGEQVLNSLSETGVTEYYRLQKNALLGIWNLSAQSQGLYSGIYTVDVSPNVEAEFLLVNNTLLVRNVGNVPYDKFVEVGIGENFTQVLVLNLSLGGSVEFQLEAPNGNYSVIVGDGSSNIDGIAALTGEVIGIKDSRRGGLFFVNKFAFAWIIIIGILGLFIFVSARKIKGKNFTLSFKGLKGLKKNKIKDVGGVVKVNSDNTESSADVSQANTADNTLVVKGEKQKASLLSLRVKNQNQSNSEIVNKAINSISESNGKVYKSGNYVVGVFAPAITRTYDNNLDAVKIADEITNSFNEYNNKYKHKVDFGIGISEGDIVAEKRDGKLLFTPLGNAMQNVKKISDIAENNYLLSEEANTALKSKLKTIANPKKFNVKTYSVNDVLDKAQHAQFINKFLDRNYKKLDDYKV
jgi:hypothetical protein